MKQKEIEKYRKAGKIAREIKKYAREIIKPNILLLEIAEKIEAKILELGGKPAFPVNLSINDIAAHYSPLINDDKKASGLLKVDIGIHIDGYIADTTLSIDLENSKENKALISATEKALQEAIKLLKNKKTNIETYEIGEKIHETITSLDLSPVINLSGHSLDKNKIHSGITIPNHNNNNKTKLKQGAYAIEPFSTTGVGKVYEGKPSGIYRLKEKKPIREMKARKILKFIEQEFSTLPFCSRWVEKKFPQSQFSLDLLEKADILHQYPQLIEKSHKKVAQAEHTLILTKKEVEIIT